MVCPGLIDIHVHLRVPGLEYKEDLTLGATGGSSGRVHGGGLYAKYEPVHRQRTDRARSARAGGAGFPARRGCTSSRPLSKGMANRELSEMGDLKDAGAVAVSDDAYAVQDAEFMRRAFEYAGMLGLACVAALRGRQP